MIFQELDRAGGDRTRGEEGFHGRKSGPARLRRNAVRRRPFRRRGRTVGWKDAVGRGCPPTMLLSTRFRLANQRTPIFCRSLVLSVSPTEHHAL
ncbi:MAG: hypothetical protein BJ554DRAFT_958 [Olpidium bornovanus]|uniref:Uncharacterized protein n=1 Tax=Olpidium bornovanus TaxID=278681 RepID=A0A8H7ZT91_9FUNG|nr:MAG: hypothetical protein BJ554DRAFT_958 [Olpidium bornovanus]